MASSVPVISSNSGGLSEVNKDGFSGYLSTVGNVSEMTEKALQILKNDDSLNQFKLNAKAQSLNFDIHAIVPKYESIYQKTLSKCLVK